MDAPIYWETSSCIRMDLFHFPFSSLQSYINGLGLRVIRELFDRDLKINISFSYRWANNNSLKNILSIIKLHYLWSWFGLKEPILNPVISPACLESIAVEYCKELFEHIFCLTLSNCSLAFDGFIILYIRVAIGGIHMVDVSETCFGICFIYLSG